MTRFILGAIGFFVSAVIVFAVADLIGFSGDEVVVKCIAFVVAMGAYKIISSYGKKPDATDAKDEKEQ